MQEAVQEVIIRCLKYQGMESRYERIVDAYPETFEWPFHDSTTEQLSWDNLCEWLKSGTGVYRINGKAGSGISTLMKHIYDEGKTKTYFKMWTHPDHIKDAEVISLCTATFFFWNSLFDIGISTRAISISVFGPEPLLL